MQPLSKRNDIGMLWENFIISERKKQLLYEGKQVRGYFWRNYAGAEVDYIEETSAGLSAYEIKYSKARVKPPKAWSDNYVADFHVITREDYLDYLL